MCQQYISRYSGRVQDCFSNHFEVREKSNVFVAITLFMRTVFSQNMEGNVAKAFTE